MIRHWIRRQHDQRDKVLIATQETAKRNAELRQLVDQLKQAYHVREAK